MFAENLVPLFDPAVFAVSATVNGASVNVIFDDADANALDIAGTQPQITCRVVDSASWTVGMNVTGLPNGSTYKIRDFRPDGTGVVVVMLEQQ